MGGYGNDSRAVGRDDRRDGYGGKGGGRGFGDRDRDRGYGGGRGGGYSNRDRDHDRDRGDRGGKGGFDNRDGKGGKGKGKGGGKKGGGKGGGKRRRNPEEEDVERQLEGLQRGMAIVSPHFVMQLGGTIVRQLAFELKDGGGELVTADALGQTRWDQVGEQLFGRFIRQICKSEDTSLDAIRDEFVLAGSVMLVRNPLILPDEYEPMTVKVRMGRKIEELTATIRSDRDIMLSMDDEEARQATVTMAQNIIATALRQKYKTMCPKTKKLLGEGRQDSGLNIMEGIRPRVIDLVDHGLALELEPVVKVTSGLPLSQLLRQGMNPVDLLGSTVCTPHNHVMYKFRSVLQGQNASTYTFMQKGMEVTLGQYFASRYSLRVPDDDMVIEAKNADGKRCALPASLCNTDKLSPDQTAMLPGLCSLQPAQRYQLVDQCARFLQEDAVVQLLEGWGITVCTDQLIRHEAVRVDPVQLVVGDARPQCITADFGRSLSRFRYDSKLPREQFNTLVMGNNQRAARVAAGRWRAIAGEIGRANGPFNVRGGREEDAGGRWAEVVGNARLPPGSVAFVGISDGNKYDYAEVKELCVERGIVSQCQNIKKTEEMRSINIITANFAKQIMHKKGLLSWWVPLEESVPELKGKTVMVVGVDVNRMEAEMSGNADSRRLTAKHTAHAGFVAWLYNPRGEGAHRWMHYCDVVSKSHERTVYMGGGDDTASSWGQSEAATSGADFASTGSKLQAFLLAAGRRFQQRGVGKVDEIVVMRDGGSVGNWETIQELEAVQVANAVDQENVWGGRPGSTFMVLNKRPSTRFLADGETCRRVNVPGEGHYNVPRGLVVTGLTEHESSSMPGSFWLVPHSCNLSTTIPIKYLVAAQTPDEQDQTLSLDALPKLCFDLGYMYPNWTDAVKVPFPVQCAKKLTELFSLMSKEAKIADVLRDGPFYL